MKKIHMLFNCSNIFTEAKKLEFPFRRTYYKNFSSDFFFDYFLESVQKNNVFEELTLSSLSDVQLFKILKVLKEKNHSLKKIRLDYISSQNDCLNLFYELLEKHKIFFNLEVLDVTYVEVTKFLKLFKMLSEHEKNNIPIRKLAISVDENSFKASLNDLCNILTRSKLEKLTLRLEPFEIDKLIQIEKDHNVNFLETIKQCQIKELLLNLGYKYIHLREVDFIRSILNSVKEAKNIKSFGIRYHHDEERVSDYYHGIFYSLDEIIESRRYFDSFDFDFSIPSNSKEKIKNLLNKLSSLTCLNKIKIGNFIGVDEENVNALRNLLRNNKKLKVLKLNLFVNNNKNISLLNDVIWEIIFHDSLKKVHICGISLDIKSETICEIINRNRSIEELKIPINLNNDNSFNLSKLEEALMNNYVITKLDIRDTIKGLKITSDVIERELRNNLQLKCQQK